MSIVVARASCAADAPDVALTALGPHVVVVVDGDRQVQAAAVAAAVAAVGVVVLVLQ